MSYRTWLTKARSVHDIGGEFYAPKGGEPWDDARDQRASEKWQRHARQPVPVEEAFRTCFGGWMHDSTVLGIERLGSRFRVRLNSIKACDFASYLAQVIGADPVDRRYRVDLILHDVSYVRAARHDRLGHLRFADWERLSGSEFLGDWFFEQDGRLQWIAQIYDRLPRGSALSDDVFLMVDCARATADDRSAEALVDAYGAPAARLYRDALAGRDDRPIDFDVFSSSKTEDYIRRRMAVHHLTPSNFRRGK
jgi:hypothetical protein